MWGSCEKVKQCENGDCECEREDKDEFQCINMFQCIDT